MRESKKTPYKELGSSLKSIRLGLKESLAEVSGAVEIDLEMLDKIEQGQECPSEDILLLLISYFDIKDDEATKLWEMAGYDKQKAKDEYTKQMMVVLPMDSRIVYTDSLQVVVNNYGVVMNFMQNIGPGNQVPIARVGMSREHADKVLEVLKQTLEQANKPIIKSLPEQKQTDKSETNN